MAQQLLRQNFSKILCRYPFHNHASTDTAFCIQTENISRQQYVFMSSWERDRKSGYRRPDGDPKSKHVWDGVKMVGSEMGMWSEEMKRKLKVDPKILNTQHEDSECVWKFNEQNRVEEWTVTSDSDNNEGHSQANFILSKNKTGLFHGHLSRRVPKDGHTKSSGYCNIRSPTKYLSFKREDVYDWTSFTHLLLRVRGDGRPYMLTINMEHLFDVHWHDQHHYILFTRGGPYWQTSKIPFSKFYATSKGRIQDKQAPIQLDKVTHLGISIGDDNEGPFSLEIDSISVMFDENHEEQFAYD